MEAFIQHLRSARERRSSRSPISPTPRSSISGFWRRSSGAISLSPQTYVRAFLREYALSVGLDPDETLHAYDAATGPRIEAAPGGPSADAPEAPQPPAPPARASPGGGALHQPTLARVAVVTILVLAAVVIAWNLLKPDAMPSVAERPFDESGRNMSAQWIRRPGRRPPPSSRGATASRWWPSPATRPGCSS